MLFSQFMPLSPYPTASTSVLYICISIPALQIILLYHFPRFHVYALIYNISIFLTYLTLYDKLWIHPHLYKCSNFIHFYAWGILHYICLPYLLYPFICQWTFRLLPHPGNCKQCCSETGVHVTLSSLFSGAQSLMKCCHDLLKRDFPSITFLTLA